MSQYFAILTKPDAKLTHFAEVVGPFETEEALAEFIKDIMPPSGMHQLFSAGYLDFGKRTDPEDCRGRFKMSAMKVYGTTDLAVMEEIIAKETEDS
jgi:hypothetical protein